MEFLSRLLISFCICSLASMVEAVAFFLSQDWAASKILICSFSWVIPVSRLHEKNSKTTKAKNIEWTKVLDWSRVLKLVIKWLFFINFFWLAFRLELTFTVLRWTLFYKLDSSLLFLVAFEKISLLIKINHEQSYKWIQRLPHQNERSDSKQG